MAAWCVCPWGGGTPATLAVRDWSEPTERGAAMAGVFDIDLDQPEENVSDDENEEVREAAGGTLKRRHKLFMPAAAVSP